MTTSLELRHVSKRYGAVAVLSDCTLIVAAGAHTAILGRSATGKSTALRLLAGLELPTTGQVLVDGSMASEPGRLVLPPHRRHIAMVFQDLGLWPTLSVIDNVLLGLSSSNRGRHHRRTQAMAALRVCGIESLADRRPGWLSGGEQQRVALARAISAEPRFLLLDEPFAGLDLCTKRTLLADVADLAITRDMTLVLVTHDPDEALSLCGRAVVLDGGRAQVDGPWSEVLQDAGSDVLCAFRESLRGAARPTDRY